MRNLSIIIPHFQKQDTLVEVVDELRLQIHQDDEIIIVDDHSPDGVPEFDCPCVQVIKPPKHTPHIYRLCTIRNYGLEHAKHDFCIILDPDCIPNPRFIQKARKMCDSSILYGGAINKIRQDKTIKTDPRGTKSVWVDGKDNGGAGIWGGCMLFSKSRTELCGWFDEAFNTRWGAEEHDFASRCYHSGMRLRFSRELEVTHQWHPKWVQGNDDNKKLWRENAENHRKHLNMFSSYTPAVGVMVITLLRPDLISQCLQSIFRTTLPLKVRLIVNGDDSKDTQRIARQWENRWAVDLANHERKWPAVVRNDTMRWARDKGYKYLVFIDDDMIVANNGILRLVQAAEAYPEYYAISGCFRSSRGLPVRMLGGPLRDGRFFHLPPTKGVFESDWVGGGYTLHRLEPLLLYDEDYQTGYNDYDWSMRAKNKGYKLGVTGNAQGYHGYKITNRGLTRYTNPSDYNRIRYNRTRHTEMRELFKKKWGFNLKDGGIWRK